MMNEPKTALPPLTRYFNYQTFETHFMDAVESLPPNSYSFSFLGSSVENRSIYGLRLGHGDFKILAWSQMHGNESTTTRALVDLLRSPDLFEILKGITLYIIPVLNPDGLEKWTRVNANQIDLNRDAIDLSQPESQILKDTLDFFEPHLALNLHGQRTFYGALDSVLPAQLSFLTPSADESKTLTPSRLISMRLINKVNQVVGSGMKAAIARYDDSFNANCWGDHCQSMEIPTILFEAGHAGDDYERDQVKELILKSLKTVFRNCVIDTDSEDDQIIESYVAIPEITRNYCDILIKNAPAANGVADLVVMYHEVIIDLELFFIPMLFAINEPSVLYGHRIIDLKDSSDFKNDLEIHNDMSVSSKSLKITSFIK
jgi:hypothetical protein